MLHVYFIISEKHLLTVIPVADKGSQLTLLFMRRDYFIVILLQ
jgi:hypothetical protein